MRLRYVLLCAVCARLDWTGTISLLESSQAARSGGCFPGDAEVRTPEGPRRLSDLRLGDSVLARDASSGELVFSEVLMFLDYAPEERRQFLRIRTAGNRTLTLTPAHLVPVRRRGQQVGSGDDDGELIVTEFAERVAVGDELLVRGATRHDRPVLDAVTDVQLVLERGVFAPLTRSGTVVVDDVVASCYAVVNSQSLAQWAFAPLRIWHNMEESLQRLGGALARPLGFWSSPSSRLRGAVPEHGVHWYASALYSVGRYALPDTWLHQ